MLAPTTDFDAPNQLAQLDEDRAYRRITAHFAPTKTLSSVASELLMLPAERR